MSKYFKYILKLNRKKSKRNWNVLTKPHLFLHFQMNVQTYIHTHTNILLSNNDTLNATKKMNWMSSCKSKQPTSWCNVFTMLKNIVSHQILEYTNTYTCTSTSIYGMPVKAASNHKACQVWMKYAKCKYCGWVLSYSREIQARKREQKQKQKLMKKKERKKNCIRNVWHVSLLWICYYTGWNECI